ncbi:hypothetical protein BT67DRAFT_439130 [Trichocladium antarcticum]|uniref:Retrovirus-related Pol polyprotein from transposon TNT 1-94-like beta-barrel domain-containing protein n=1 Tax=Trichocladium antarcticum TaxID=1450529 RepID=A0AAN6URL1_9PEZI|nr:hypothetical protein BT67DRAFT_439130 [Trichocladium antarcticum]
MTSSSETTGLCPDWVLSNNSTAHVARDRAWFSTYTPFQTYATTFLSGGQLKVIGIGEVQLPVKLFPKRSGAAAHGTLHLRNVLHVPTAFCNIIGGPHTGDYDRTQLGGLGDSGNDGAITAKDGRRLGYFDSRGLWVLKLSGPPVGPIVGSPVIKPGEHYMIHAFWPDSERARWAAAQASLTDLDHPTNPLNPTVNTQGGVSDGGKREEKAQAVPSAPYTKEEKDWLKGHYETEFKFLVTQGLSIYKDEDRDEGRRIVRAMMEQDEDSDTDMLTGGASGLGTGRSKGLLGSNNDDEAEDDERSLQGHFADYNFTEEELDFIERGWGNTESFMLSFGLKFYKDEDCEEAQAIVRVLMAPEDSDSEEDKDVE